ncbi:MAG: histidine phosphatase family protein [Thaumarchaeota archaeon]|nr:histidine phosphatase family protein [Nitrososphaerota archaeon]
MTKVFFIRHGESEGNVKGILTGRVIPAPLTEKGRTQIADLGEDLKGLPFEAIFSSPIMRAVQTSEILSDALGVKFTTDERFTETDFGSLAGRNVQQVYGEDIDWHREFYSDSYVKYGVEKFSNIMRRVEKGAADISGRHPNGNVIVVSHYHPVKGAVALALGMDPEVIKGLRIGNGSVSVVSFGNGDTKLLAFNVMKISRYFSL